ncbi:MAG: (2Fe-2S)-binding protein [Bacilli bacterium]|jgi:NAD(P)H-nitrite reductase large subunit|nr:(2Fe-2S)-binding protein [Bacilli bacterium]MDY0063500.1 (2Fe-2S)-binding protein [Bacilli bacterium]
MNKKDIILCRCEDISLQDLHDLFARGFTDLEEIKRMLRIGMGPCQGNTCIPLVQKELSRYLNQKIEDIANPTVRPPLTGIKLSSIWEDKNES